MTRWYDVGPVSDFPRDQARECVAGDIVVAVVHTSDGIYAMDGICPHQGGPLGQGQLCGKVLTCPWHGWQYDITTGAHSINPGIGHPTFPAKVEEGRVWIQIPTADQVARRST